MKRTPGIIRVGPLLAVAGLLLGSFLFCRAAFAGQNEDWSVITIAGVPVGYIHETGPATDPEGLRTSISEMKMVLNRLGQKVEIVFISSAVETPDGRLRKSDYEMRASMLSTKAEAVVKDGVIEIRSEAGGRAYTRTIEFAGVILGPEGIRAISENRLKESGDSVEFLTFAAEAGAVTKGSRKVLGRERLLVAGREIETLKVEEVFEAAGIKGFAWLDDRFETVKAETPTPFGPSEIVRSDRDTALAAAGEGELPAELFSRSILRSNVRLPRPREIEYLKVRLRRPVSADDWPDVSGGHQAEVSRKPDVLVLEVRRPAVPPASLRPAKAGMVGEEFLAPNEYIQSDLPEIAAEAERIIGDETDAYRSSLKLVRWIAENMTFDLGIALAPASELFRNRRGTCLGYATLLATLARAAGIPSRVVVGYVYALGMFGGHAWTEVFAGGAWIPLDATIVSAGVADAARVAFAASSLKDGAAGLSGPAAQRLFGQVEVEVAEYAVEGRGKIIVREKTTPFEIRGDVYSNPGLGLTFKKPAGFSFGKTDAVWPDSLVVALAGPGGLSVELRELYLQPWKDFASAVKEQFSRLGLRGEVTAKKAGGLAGWGGADGSKAAIVLRNGSAAWLILAEGPDAAASLDRVVRGLAFR